MQNNVSFRSQTALAVANSGIGGDVYMSGNPQRIYAICVPRDEISTNPSWPEGLVRLSAPIVGMAVQEPFLQLARLQYTTYCGVVRFTLRRFSFYRTINYNH